MEDWKTKARELRAKRYKYREIAEMLGISMGTVNSYLSYCDKVPVEPIAVESVTPATPEEIIEHGAKRELEKQEARQTRAELEKASRNKIVIDQLVYCEKITKPYPVKRLKVPDISGRSRNTTPVLGLCDIHAGLFLKESETGGLNYYNRGKLEMQVENLKNALVTISIKQLAEHPLLKIHCLGDMLDGIGIFASQAFQQELHLKEQYYFLAELISTFLVELLQLYDVIELCCIPGNHGRIGKKGESAVEDNIEYFWYRHMQEKLQNYPQIKWKISESWWMLDNTYDKTSLLIHGDGIKSWMTIPYYGVERADTRYTKVLASMKNMYQILELGHFHSMAILPSPTGCTMINGCFTGGSMLALKDMITTSEPAQLFFGIHRDLPSVNWWHPIYLNYPKGEKK